MNCPHYRGRGEPVCLGCRNLAQRSMPRTIAALRELVARVPEEQPAIWALVVAAVEEATTEANKTTFERVKRIVSVIDGSLHRYLPPPESKWNCPQAERNGRPCAVFCPLCHPMPKNSERNEALRAAVGSLEHAPDLEAIAEVGTAMAALEAIAEVGTAMAALMHQLATCEHEVTRQTEQATGLRAPWCPSCGAHRTWEYGAQWIPSELAREAKDLDAARQRLGAGWGRPSYDSDVKNVIPIKPRT
jgi:hypothetical protein